MDGFAGFVTTAAGSTARAGFSVAVVALATFSACRQSTTSPSPTAAIVTFRVVNETFRALLNDPATIDLARRTLAGTIKRFPNGRIAPGTNVNSGWSWHLTDVEMVEVSIELCDGRPSDVERAGVVYGGGRFCPWSATVVSIEDR